MPKVSICMPIYNSDKGFLKEAIESVLSQTYEDYEFVIFNDGSIDDSLDVMIREYQANDKRIRYVKNVENKGISNARNTMISLAKGEYIANMDHDDISLPTRIEKQVGFLERNRDVGVCGTYYKKIGTFFKKLTVRYPLNHLSIQAFLCFKCAMHHPSAMFRKSIIVDNDIKYDGKLISVNDMKFFVDVSCHTKLANIPEVLCIYRVHNKMTSRVKRAEIIKEQIELRNYFFEKLNISFTQEELGVFNHYIVNGRNSIKDKQILVEIDKILTKLCEANRRSSLLSQEEFERVCAIYLIKRCFNAAILSFISSRDILESTRLPIEKIKISNFLSFINTIKAS